MVEITQSLLPEELKDFKYYLRKVPEYLRKSNGFVEHFRIWYDLLIGEITNEKSTGLLQSSETLLYLFDIYNSDFLNTINSLEGANEINSDILDKIANIFGLKRNFRIDYRTVDGTNVSKNISLNNAEFLILIKAQIIKNYSDGTFEQTNNLYLESGLIVVINSESYASCSLYLTDFVSYSENIKDLFLSGLLTISSLGVVYNHVILNVELVFTWDSDGDKSIWDKGVWTV